VVSNDQRPHDLYQAEHADRLNARLGGGLFLIYLTVYAAFVLVCAFTLHVMATPVLGVNLAIVCGFGLIGFAIVLAVIYMVLCHPSGGNGNGREGAGDAR
jgi:uncharacterized membrane protein (DUF485 family)